MNRSLVRSGIDVASFRKHDRQMPPQYGRFSCLPERRTNLAWKGNRYGDWFEDDRSRVTPLGHHGIGGESVRKS
jgi:hypothetical protein